MYYIQKKLNTDYFKMAIFACLLVAVLSLGFLYIFWINKSILSIVAAERADREIAAIAAEVGKLEQRYLFLRNSIDIELAVKLGFYEDINKVRFSSGLTDTKGLSLKP